MKEKNDIQKTISKLLVEGRKRIKDISGSTQEEKWADLLNKLTSPLSQSIHLLTNKIAYLEKSILKYQGTKETKKGKKYPIPQEILDLLKKPRWREEQRSKIDEILYRDKEIQLQELAEIFKHLYAFVLLECADIRVKQTTNDSRIRELEIKDLL